MSQVSELEQRTISKAMWRLIPFMCVCYIAAFVDRVNVGFAKLKMMDDLGLSDTVYGTGAGIFFLGYFLFEVPSNLIMERVGARIWIARIMIVWGVISALMMFVVDQWSFLGLRFLLGAAEAGFFPGMILYLTYWFPTAYRSRMVSLFMTAAVSSFIIGGPLSGWLMEHPHFGLADWRWLFLAEGIPSVLLGLVVLWYLPNGPRTARWLEPAELAWLSSRLEEERAQQEKKQHFTLRQALTNPKVLLLSLIYFLNVVGGYGFDFFQPQILRNAFPACSKQELGYLTAIPALITIPIMIWYGRSSDRKKERRFHVALAAWVFCAGLVLLSYGGSGTRVLTAMTLCVIGRWCMIGPFWGLPTAFLTGTAAAGGIALINSIGNLGGQAGPVIVGAYKDASGYGTGLRILAVLVFLCGVITLFVRIPKAEPDLEPAPEPSSAYI